jgi:SAM-dependent methyltransferase
MPESTSMFSNADSYESYVGRWSRLVALQFITWLDVPAGGAWLDVGAGTGVLTRVILDQAAPVRVIGVDSSAEYTATAREQVRDLRVEFRLGDAGEMTFQEAGFDAAVAGLVLNFVPDPVRVVGAMARAVRPGGLVAAYVWDYSGGMEMMRHFWEAANRLDPAARSLDPGARFTICRPEALHRLFESAELNDVATRAIDIETAFSSFEDYWQPLEGAQGSLSVYVRGMTPEQRHALRETLRTQLPVAADGHIPLKARAWAVKGYTV